MEPAAIQPDEIDSARLRAIVARFRAHHALRIERTGARLISRHRRVLDVLPMLFHRNHPALPGYVGAQAPHGISGFRPGGGEIRALRMVVRSYEEPLLPPQRCDIQAMFLMGSGGTIGQSSSSDVDLWVCCDSLVHAALWPKVRVIERWAADLGLELHTFVVDPALLRRHRQLPGSRIPTLVLDEFYRTGALLAGRHPLWWLIDEDEPGRYAELRERLLRQRFVPEDHVVDFGPVGTIPPDELIQGVLIELHRALDTPHKSLLKLELMEAYAAAPDLGVASSAYRARVHAGVEDPLALDPYLLMYEHVEQFLRRAGRENEITMARRLLIGKAAENVPWQGAATSTPEAANLMERFRQWGFHAQAVARFRSLDEWPLRERLAENARILRALERGLSLVRGLMAGSAGVTPPGAISVPINSARPADGEQLRRLNEKRLGQLDDAVDHLRARGEHTVSVLHPALITRRHSPTLRLHRETGCWRIHESAVPVKRCARLVEAVIWSELNGARLVPAPRENDLAPVMLQVLQSFCTPGADVHAFVNAESLTGHGPAPGTVAGGPAGLDAAPVGGDDVTTSLRAGSSSGYEALHLISLDVVSRTAQDHWRFQVATDPGVVLDTFGGLLASPPDTVSWQAPGGQQRFVLVERIRRLHQLAWRLLESPGGLFVLPFGSTTITVRRHAGTVETRRHRTPAELEVYLQSSVHAAGGKPRHDDLSRAS